MAMQWASSRLNCWTPSGSTTNRIELYDQQPEFDNCEQSSVRPVFEVDYNDYPTEQHVKTITLQADAAEKLLIVYTTNKNEGFPNVNEVRFAR